MRLIIDISKNEYNDIIEQVKKCDYPDMGLGKIIANGTPFPTGEWIKSEFRIVYGVLGKFDYLCSRCTNRFDYPFAFCPNCGAKMEMKGLFK